jgi:hypothetical protein
MANHHSLDNEAAQKENGLSVAVYGIMNEEQQGNEILSHAAKFTQSFTDAYNTANGTDYAVSTNVEFGPEEIANPHGGTTFPVINNSTWSRPIDSDFDVSGHPRADVIYGAGPLISDPVATYTTVTTNTQIAHTTYESRAEYSEEKSSKIVSSLIPYMRAVTLKYIVTGLKRDSIFNVFADKIDLSGYTVPSTELTVSVTSGTFDTKSVVGSEDADIRKVSGNKVTALNIGDVITGGTSSATGVLLGIEKTSGSDIVLFVSNVKGTFAASEVITGSVSSAIATISTINTPTTAKSSAYGNLYGLLTIPNEGDKKLVVGEKEIIFTTSGLSDIFSESFAIVDFSSTGTLMSTQPKVSSIRNWVTHPVTTYTTESSTQQVRGDDIIVTRAGEEIAIGLSWHAQWECPVDPLCQTFFVEDDTGIFVTGIDLYFGQKDTSGIPIYVSIVDTVNGYPGPRSLPLSEVYVDAADIIVDTVNTTTVGSKTYGNPTPTNIKFRAPVYLEGGKEYGIYIKSDSEKYVVWTSYMGEDDLSGGGSIQTQPLLGSLFKSQSASAWTTDQYEDLTFKLYRAEYLRQKFGLKITNNIKVDDLQPAFKDKILPGTNLEYEYKKYNDTSYTKVVNRLNKSTPSTISILNPVGETAQYSGNSSLEFKATLTTTDAKISPIINIAGIDALCSTNRINLPDITNINTALDVGSFTSGTLTTPSPSGNIISTADAATILEFGKFKIGMNLHIYDSFGGADLGNFIITDISADKTTVTVDLSFTMTGTTLYIKYNTRYLDEITPVGSTSASKYVSRPLQFVNISTGFKLFFTYNQPYNTNIDFYYRTSNSGVEGVIHKELKYTKIDNIGTKSSNNKGGFFEGNVTVTGVDDYDIISVKIVFNSGNSNKAPRLRDFRIVAVA